MSKHSDRGGQPQYIHLRAGYELPDNRVRGQRRSVLGGFCIGALRAALIGLLPVLLVVGYLDYVANGWARFFHELVAHLEFIFIPLAAIAVIGGVIGVIRR